MLFHGIFGPAHVLEWDCSCREARFSQTYGRPWSPRKGKCPLGDNRGLNVSPDLSGGAHSIRVSDAHGGDEGFGKTVLSCNGIRQGQGTKKTLRKRELTERVK